MFKLKKILNIIFLIILIFSLQSCMDTSNNKNISNKENESYNYSYESESEKTNNESTIESNTSIYDEIVHTDSISYDYKDYIGDIETFVYGLISNELSVYYDTFPALVYIDGYDEFYGIGFTNYEDVFVTKDGKYYFTSGFLSFKDEDAIPNLDSSDGIELINLDFEYPNYSFVLTNRFEPFKRHCKVFNKYLIYGVDENNCIYYTFADYDRNIVDTNLGSLYSYDDSRLLYDDGFGDYKPIIGISLDEILDYDDIEKKVNKIIEDQNEYFSEYDIENALYISQEAVNSYLLSLQTENFLGFDVSELIEASKELNPRECFKIGTDGLTLVEIEKVPPKTPSAFVKWMTGITCGITIVAGTAIDIFIPALKPITGALVGASMEVFMQVVIENRDLTDIEWSKVAVYAACGALCSVVGPHVTSFTSKGIGSVLGSSTKISQEAAVQIATYAGKFVGVLSTSAIVATATASCKAIDGGNASDIAKTFGITFGVGVAIGVSMEAIGAGVSALAKTVCEKHPNNWAQRAYNSTSSYISGHQVHLGKLDDIVIAKSAYESACIGYEMGYQKRLVKYATQLNVLKVLNLPNAKSSNFTFLDNDGNIISKRDLIENGGNGILKINNSNYEFYDRDGNLVKEFNIVDGTPDFSPMSKAEVTNINITTKRNFNFKNFEEKLANTFNESPENINSDILAWLKNNGYDPEYGEVTAKSIREMRSALQLTWHECADGITAELVPTYIHSKVSHFGGVGVAKLQAKWKVGTLYFKQLSQGV